MIAATYRGARRPAASSVSPDEEMSSTAPPTSPSTATMANGNRYQVGRIVVSAPIGSAEIAPFSLVDDPASSRPNPSRKIGAMDAPNVVQPTTERLDVSRGRE